MHTTGPIFTPFTPIPVPGRGNRPTPACPRQPRDIGCLLVGGTPPLGMAGVRTRGQGNLGHSRCMGFAKKVIMGQAALDHNIRLHVEHFLMHLHHSIRWRAVG